ncbi:MarR family transcriptional regulator [Sporosarcina limicola]|uniref:DNA-binding MarR family transcriptional regulator n=1 Tax=Sporosarcina limicola TaxID=34101 RepID=A0A927R5A3_9BACL|nr:DNA-binding MarR family transcriptional regulator [Sporosarcina limicola]
MDMKDLFNKFVLFSASVHRVTHDITKNAKSDTVTPVQYNILEYIAVSQPVTLSEISDCQQMSMPNTSRELKKLSDKDLIAKQEDTVDRRKQSIRLSKDGEVMMNEAFGCIETQLLHRLEGVSKEDLEAIDCALDILQTKVFY